MKARTKVKIADGVVTAALVIFAIATFHQMHGWPLVAAWVIYALAILALGYLAEKAKTATTASKPRLVCAVDGRRLALPGLTVCQRHAGRVPGRRP